ncbi:Regulatory protein ADR1 [Bienertia sinuspersici]
MEDNEGFGSKMLPIFSAYPVPNLKRAIKIHVLPKLQQVSRVYALHSDSDANLEVSPKSNADIPKIHKGLQLSSKINTGVLMTNFASLEPFGGKPGSVSFYGVTHHVVEERKIVASPYEDGGSVLWVFAPLVLILSLILPPVYLSNFFDSLFKNVILSEIVTTICSEAVFYTGIAIFLSITDYIQRPYLQFSAKRWGLITGLKGHLTSSFFAMGLKVVAPLAVSIGAWPLIGWKAFVAVCPLLLGYLAQYVLENFIDRQGSSCWPIVPIIFEVYRLYQLTRAGSVVESLMFAISRAPPTPELTQKHGALAALSLTFYIVALVCLWSLLTFLMRLFPSRPVAEKY